MYSFDGVTFFETPGQPLRHVFEVMYVDTPAHRRGYYACGRALGSPSTNTAFSLNGIFWVRGGPPVFAIDTSGFLTCGLAYSASLDTFVMVANVAANTTVEFNNTIAYSRGGFFNFTGVGTSLFDLAGNGVAYGNGLFIAAGGYRFGLVTPPTFNGNVGGRSVDGITWSPIQISWLSTALSAAYSSAEGIYALAGIRASSGPGNPEVFAFSRDGISWSPGPVNGVSLFGSNPFAAYSIFSVSFMLFVLLDMMGSLKGNGVWVAVGGNLGEASKVSDVAYGTALNGKPKSFGKNSSNLWKGTWANMLINVNTSQPRSGSYNSILKQYLIADSDNSDWNASVISSSAASFGSPPQTWSAFNLRAFLSNGVYTCAGRTESELSASPTRVNSSQFEGNFQVSGTLVVGGSSQLLGTMRVDGRLEIADPNSNFTLSEATIFIAGTLSLAPNATVQVPNGVALFGPNSHLELSIDDLMLSSGTVSVPVVSFGVQSANFPEFASVQVISVSGCSSLSNPVQSTSSSTLSVTFSVTRIPCSALQSSASLSPNESVLSTGAIIGISIACVVVASAVVIGGILLFQRNTRIRTAKMNRDIARRTAHMLQHVNL